MVIGKVVGESVLIDRLAHSAEWDWLRVNTWSDHGRQVEDVLRRLVDLDWCVADGHVLVDQESRLGGAPGDLYAADGFWTLTQLLAANAWHQALLRSWCVVAT